MYEKLHLGTAQNTSCMADALEYCVSFAGYPNSFLVCSVGQVQVVSEVSPDLQLMIIFIIN